MWEQLEIVEGKKQRWKVRLKEGYGWVCVLLVLFCGVGGDFLALGVTVPLGTFRKAISTTYRNCISVGSEP